MPTLKVDLQELFSGETVVLRLNGKEVYRGTPKTRQQIGLAESKLFELPEQHLTLEAAVPLSGLSKSIDIDLSENLYVGVSLSPGEGISLNTSAQPFGYL